MGRTADRKNKKRAKELSRLAQANPELFERKLAKRVDSWAGQIWKSSKDRVFLSENEYKELLSKYPTAKETIESISVPLYTKLNVLDGVHCYLNTLEEVRGELGSDVVGDILSHVKRGTLMGERIFSIVDNARKTLVNCGQKAQETIDLLENECCRALAPHIGHEIYTLNHYRKPKE